MKKNISKFKTEAEERLFWQNTDSAEYDWSDAEEVILPNLKPSTRTISVRLPESMLEELKILANKRDIPHIRKNTGQSHEIFKLYIYHIFTICNINYIRLHKLLIIITFLFYMQLP